MYRYTSKNIYIIIIRINYLVSPKLFRAPISTRCVQNQGYNYLGKRGLAAGGLLGLYYSKCVIYR
jgi:hypothetical protein